MKQLNFNNQRENLTDEDVHELVAIVGNRCSNKTKDRLRSILKYHPTFPPQYGILNRLIKDKHGWEYCAGQSYPDEIRTVRSIILTGK